MKLAMLTWESLHSIAVGGMSAHVTELAAAIERKGHEVHVFTRMGENQPYYEQIDGVHYHRCPFDLDPDFSSEIHNFSRSLVHHVFQTEDYIGPFDLVHGHDWLTGPALSWIKEGRGRRTAWTVHATEYGRCGNQFWGGNSERIRGIERGTAWGADRVLAVSGSVQGEIQWMYEVPSDKIRVVHNAVSPHKYGRWLNPGEVKGRYGFGPLDPVVLFAGRMVYQKGPDILMEAVPKVLNSYGNAKFIFVGDGDMRQYVEEIANGNGAAGVCRFLGYVPEDEVINLYNACDVVCIPSRNEPFGIVVLEAWAAGKPVVVTHSGGPGEYVWHDVNGYMVYQHPESIAWGLGTIMHNWDHARWMGHNGRIAVETVFNWDTIADRTIWAYWN
ncbi:MAG: glycosyltransferase [Armatimonadetes bacterium]|nr:glycosyltransferase [Gemmatimonadales bacterium]NIO75904.1 glycosyltransferase [Armatimonadota bacterium]